jgi:transposase-like protein
MTIHQWWLNVNWMWMTRLLWTGSTLFETCESIGGIMLLSQWVVLMWKSTRILWKSMSLHSASGSFTKDVKILPGGWLVVLSGRCFVEEVNNRTTATLLPIIQKWVKPGTRIITDGWQAYNELQNIGGNVYSHDVIIHQENFVHPANDEINIQNIECLWRHLKSKLKRMSGTSQPLFQLYLAEFMWRRSHKDNYFGYQTHIPSVSYKK